MIFLLLAILILILSFVVALWSLVNEEKKITTDEGIKERDVERRGSTKRAVFQVQDSDTGHSGLSQDTYEPGEVIASMPPVTTKSDYKPQQVSSAPPRATGASDGRVWWEELEGKQAAGSEVVNEDEQRSIEEIRAQLSQIVASRGHTTTDETEPVEVFEDDKKINRDKRVFLGEISLSNLKRSG